MTKRVWVIGVLMGVALTAPPRPSAAESYRWVDANGAVVYADHPPRPEEAFATAPAPTAERGGAREAPVVAPPTESPRRGPATVDALLELSGVKAQLVGLASRLASEFRPRAGQMNAKDLAAVDRIAAQAFRPEAIYVLVRDEVRRLVDRPNLDAAATWLGSPLGRKITALEVASSEGGADSKVVEYAKGLQATPPPAARVELLQHLEWVSGSSEVSLEILAAITRKALKAVSAVLPPDRRLRPGQIERQVAESKARAGDAVRQQALVSMLYTYGPLEDPEIEQYVRFASSDAGRWYNTTLKKAVLRALDGVLERATVELVRAVPPERWARAVETLPPAAK